MTDNSAKTTHFGFQDVPEDQKAGMVHGVFTNVAKKYDIMNDVMSGGIHRLWKDAMMDWLAPRSGQRLLDVAGGTGDIAFRFLKRAGMAEAVVLDMTESMLIEGRKRAEAEALADKLEWVVGDAMALPFEDNSFDVYTISLGIRNVTRIGDALSEAYRVLRPGGRLMVLEFSQLPNSRRRLRECQLSQHDLRRCGPARRMENLGARPSQYLAIDPNRRNVAAHRGYEPRAGGFRRTRQSADCGTCAGLAL